MPHEKAKRCPQRRSLTEANEAAASQVSAAPLHDLSQQVSVLFVNSFFSLPLLHMFLASHFAPLHFIIHNPLEFFWPIIFFEVLRQTGSVSFYWL
jgi:hypothetical protein